MFEFLSIVLRLRRNGRQGAVPTGEQEVARCVPGDPALPVRRYNVCLGRAADDRPYGDAGRETRPLRAFRVPRAADDRPYRGTGRQIASATFPDTWSLAPGDW